jgi:uncharacterized membrane protein YeaQ/YmgE (transglycosylase-associated protein family)
VCCGSFHETFHGECPHWTSSRPSCRPGIFAVLPGRRHIPVWLTILVGAVAALVGTWLARVLRIPTATRGVDWLELLVQLVLAVTGVAIVIGIDSRRGIRR